MEMEWGRRVNVANRAGKRLRRVSKLKGNGGNIWALLSFNSVVKLLDNFHRILAEGGLASTRDANDHLFNLSVDEQNVMANLTCSHLPTFMFE